MNDQNQTGTVQCDNSFALFQLSWSSTLYLISMFLVNAFQSLCFCVVVVAFATMALRCNFIKNLYSISFYLKILKNVTKTLIISVTCVADFCLCRIGVRTIAHKH